MTPPIQKDWWLAAALTGAALPAAMGQTPSAADGRQTGIVTTVAPGVPVSGASKPIYIESTRGQKLSTGPNETLHVLFSDQSALTVGPNSEITIAEYRYDPKTRDGNVLVDMTKGLLRVVGGFISKKNATVVRTSTATIGIRGGITMAETDGQKTSGTFLFGQSMSMTDSRGGSQTVTRAGFGVDATGSGMSSPRQFTAGELQQMNANFERGGGQQGGNRQPGGAPPGQLLSTGDRGGQDPGGSLSSDRLNTVNDTRGTGGTPQTVNDNTLRNILGSGQTPVQS
jgi:hypothetical protein